MNTSGMIRQYTLRRARSSADVPGPPVSRSSAKPEDRTTWLASSNLRPKLPMSDGSEYRCQDEDDQAASDHLPRNRRISSRGRGPRRRLRHPRSRRPRRVDFVPAGGWRVRARIDTLDDGFDLLPIDGA